MSQPAPDPPRPHRDWNAVAAVIASLIGLLALCVSGYTAWLQKQQVRAEVWPRLEVVSSNINLKLWAVNQGMGPARVTGMRVSVDGRPAKRWNDVMRGFGYTGNEGFSVTTLNGSVIRPGDSVEMLSAADNDRSRKMMHAIVEDEGHELDVSICYCSVLDDCWIVHSREPVLSSAHNPRIAQCPIADADQFRN